MCLTQTNYGTFHYLNDLDVCVSSPVVQKPGSYVNQIQTINSHLQFYMCVCVCALQRTCWRWTGWIWSSPSQSLQPISSVQPKWETPELMLSCIKVREQNKHINREKKHIHVIMFFQEIILMWIIQQVFFYFKSHTGFVAYRRQLHSTENHEHIAGNKGLCLWDFFQTLL